MSDETKPSGAAKRATRREKAGHIGAGDARVTVLTQEAQRREGHLRAGVRISVFAVVWGTVTGALSLYVGVRGGSLGVIGTGGDVLADVVGSVALTWRFRAEVRGSSAPLAAERRAHGVTAGGLLVVATALAVTGALRLINHVATSVDAVSVGVAAVSLVGLPILAALKYRIAAALGSGALRTDAHTSAIGAATAAVALLGLASASLLHWSSADPVAGLLVAAIAAAAGIEGLRTARRGN